MRKISYVTPLYFSDDSYLGGGERYPVNLARATVSSGDCRIELISYGESDVSRTITISDGVTLRVLPSISTRSGGGRVSWALIDALKGCDLVHIHQAFMRSSEVAFLIAKTLGIPVALTDHGGAASLLGRDVGMLDLADGLIAYSKFGASLFRPFTEREVHVVRGGVDDSYFVPPVEPVKRSGAVYVGRLLPHKGIDRLIAALPAGLKLTICGQPYDERYLRYLKAIAEGRPVTFITNARDADLRRLYQEASAVVLPSVYRDSYGHSHPWPELMGFTLLEGMACGAPAICSRVGGMPEFVTEGETGFVFDDLAELSAALGRLDAEPLLTEQVGRAARRAVEMSFGLAAAGRAMRDVYEEILARPL